MNFLFIASVACLLIVSVHAVRETKYYDVLGIDSQADDATIKKAYRRQALRYHPDRNPDKPDAEEKFRDIAAAYEVLSDPQKRQTYDHFGEAGLNQNGGGGGPGGGGGFHFQHGDPFNIFENVFGGGMGGGGPRMHFQFNSGGMGGGGGGFHHGHGQGGGGGGGSLYKDDALVQELDEDTYPEGDGEGWAWLIEFYAPWCGHCRQLAPKWRKVAESLHGVVRVAAVNCDEQAALCQGQGIQSYPSIKAYKAGQWMEYHGDRSASHLRDWGLSLLPRDAISTLNRANQLHDFVLKSSGSGASAKWNVGIVLFTSKSETSSLYKSLALRYKGKIAFGEVRGSNKELSKQYNVTEYPSLLAFCNGDENHVVTFHDEFKNSRLAKWLNGFYGGKRCLEAIKLDENTDFSKMKVSQLKQLLSAEGETCKDCVEKSDYVRKLKEVIAAAAK